MNHTSLARWAQLALIGSTAALISGCATMEEASTSFSCMLARVTNSADPRCGAPITTGGGAAPATPTTGGQNERFARLQAALDQEAQQATALQAQAVQAMQRLPARQRAVAGPVHTRPVPITDGQSGVTSQLQSFSSLSVDMPLAAKGRNEYSRAMDALKELANELADNRGSSTILVEQSEADVSAGRVNTSSGTTQTKNGKPVTVRKKVDSSLPAGMERYTIEAGEIRGKL
ncbi:hypothetical protein DZC30_19095 [Comamonas testosteroni]|uniref:Lipoprotein n=1 Tax=Comamonas testosteroni TaxID=285 RepID=A0A373FAL8_COMTE|nr:hypothetical protein DZC30_19095 [Comamonas testosteroni]